MSLCLKTLGQGGSGGKLISCVSRSYKFQDASSRKTISQKKRYELHNFADAITAGYGQCCYLRVKDEDGNVNVSMVMGKSRFAPLKITTTPRLELTATVVSAKVGVMLQEELN